MEKVTEGSRSTDRPRVLVAEDNLANQKVAVAMLAKLGWTADVVHNGAEAVEAFRPGRYGAVLMDCQMPVMDGYAATAAIREIEQGGTRIPIIAMTAALMTGAKEGCLAAGMDDLVPKPVMLSELDSALRRWVDTTDEPSDPAETTESVQATSADLFDPNRVAALRALNAPGRPDMFTYLATTFVEQSAEHVEALGRALAERDLERAQAEAHRLRGGAATIGALRVADLCRALEERLAAGEGANADDFPPIRVEFDRVRSQLAGEAAANSG